MISDFSIRSVVSTDAAALKDIYNHYIENSVITFETTPISTPMMAQRIQSCIKKLPWLVGVINKNQIAGYAYATPWKAREAYRKTVETTVYLSPNVIGHGLGKRLYHTLLASLHDQQLHTALGGIALPNPASIALHQSLGFTQVAHLKEVGFKFDQWVDVGYWQINLTELSEGRSQ